MKIRTTKWRAAGANPRLRVWLSRVQFKMRVTMRRNSRSRSGQLRPINRNKRRNSKIPNSFWSRCIRNRKSWRPKWWADLKLPWKNPILRTCSPRILSSVKWVNGLNPVQPQLPRPKTFRIGQRSTKTNWIHKWTEKAWRRNSSNTKSLPSNSMSRSNFSRLKSRRSRGLRASPSRRDPPLLPKTMLHQYGQPSRIAIWCDPKTPESSRTRS